MSGALYQVNLLNDTVGSITVLNGGSGYTKTPNIIIDGPFNGTPAQAYCNVVNGSIDSIIVTENGSGYTKVPNIIDDYNMDIGNNRLSSGWDTIPTENNDDYYRVISSHHLFQYFKTLRQSYELSISSNSNDYVEFSENGIIHIISNYDDFIYGSCSANSNPTLYTYNDDILCYGYKNGENNGILISNQSIHHKIFKMIIFM